MLKDGLVLICRESLLSQVKPAKELATSSECAGPTSSPSEAKKALTSYRHKTGRQVWVPIFEELAAAMATWERQPGPFLRRLDGGLWESKNLRSHGVMGRTATSTSPNTSHSVWCCTVCAVIAASATPAPASRITKSLTLSECPYRWWGGILAYPHRRRTPSPQLSRYPGISR